MANHDGEQCISCLKPFRFVEIPILGKKVGYQGTDVDAMCSPETVEKLFPGKPADLKATVCHDCMKVFRQKTTIKKSTERVVQRKWLPGFSPMRSESFPLCNSNNTKSSSPSPTKKLRLQAVGLIGKSSSSSSHYKQSLLSPAAATKTKMTPVTQRSVVTETLEKAEDPSPPSKKIRPLTIIGKSSLPSPATKKNTKQRVSCKKKALHYLRKSEYVLAFRWLLLRGSQAIKSAYIQVFLELLTQEKKLLVSKDVFPAVTEENIMSFSWDTVVDQMADVSPAISACLQSLITKKNLKKSYDKNTTKERNKIEDESQKLINRRVGLIAAVILYTIKPSRHKFFQACMGLQLWRQGCPKATYHTLNQLGISQALCSVHSHNDRFRHAHNSEMNKWKESVQSETAETTFKADLYGVCWDVVKIKTSNRQSDRRTGETNFPDCGMCFAVKNRVKLDRKPNKRPLVPAKKLDSYSFLPSPDDYMKLKEHLVILVERIMVEQIPALSTFSKSVNWHIQHQFSKKMCQKSHVLNLGAVDANPTSSSGFERMLSHLSQFVPVMNGAAIPILCSAEGMAGAEGAQANGASENPQLEGLVWGPQEAHKEIILMQEMMNTFFKKAGHSSRGTLYQLQTFFQLKNLKRDVNENVQDAWDMLQFATSAYVVLCAMKIMEMTDITERPPMVEDDWDYWTPSTRQVWLKAIAVQVVEFCWLAPQREDVVKVADAIRSEDTTGTKRFPFCYCGKDKDETLLQCASSLCKKPWSHVSCANLKKIPAEDEDWYCSSRCKKDGSSIYCICQTRKNRLMVQCHLESDCRKYEWYHALCIGQNENTELPDTFQLLSSLYKLLMVQCHLESDCRKYEWYHALCIGQNENTELPDVWYCSDDCAKRSENDDCVQNHTKAIMWAGLNLLARRDAVREGNGHQVVSHWKMDMVTFWTKKHLKYFTIGHQFLSGVAGFQPLRVAFDLKWNRFANLSGKEGDNVGIDEVNELVNNDFNVMMRRYDGISHHYYNLNEVDKCAQKGGEFGKKLNKICVTRDLWPNNAEISQNRFLSMDIKEFTEEFQDDALFDYCPVRYHEGFEDFHLDSVSHIPSPQDMGKELSALSVQLDLQKSLRANHTSSTSDPIPGAVSDFDHSPTTLPFAQDDMVYTLQTEQQLTLSPSTSDPPSTVFDIDHASTTLLLDQNDMVYTSTLVPNVTVTSAYDEMSDITVEMPDVDVLVEPP